MERIAIRIPWLVAIFALVVACGIPTSPFLGSPDRDDVVWSIFAPPSVTFAHNVTDNSTENFRGYEIYYKFYQYTPAPLGGEFGTDHAVLDAAASGSGKSTVEAHGFRRIWEAGDIVGAPPLISIDPSESATAFDVQLIFPDKVSALLPPDPVLPPASAVFLGRNVELVRDPQAGTEPTGKTFESDDLSTDPNDPDIPAGISPTDDRIHIAFVILAYGIDFTGGTFGSIYSDPFMVEEPLEIILQ